MENTNIVLAGNIQNYRKNCGLTQEELADRLGVTFQAVSKWENAKCAPDILFLPLMANLFGCSIDALFSRERQTDPNDCACSQLPWDDDDVIRGVVFEGRKILKVTDGLKDKFTFEIIGDTNHVQSECSITVSGDVCGDCNAGGTIICDGDICGDCNAGGKIICSGDIPGDCNAGGTISCGGDISGNCTAGAEITCNGDLDGTISCDGTITVGGDVTSGSIKGNVICNSLKCDQIEGNVTVGES